MNKLYLIIINSVTDVDVKNIGNLLGLDQLKERDEIYFMSAQFISEGYCIGTYENNMLIVDPFGVFKFFRPIISDFEYMLCKIVPKAEIIVLSLYSVIDSYGFAIIDKGKRIRVKYAGDNTVYFDYGEKLKEEIDIEREGYNVDGGVVERLFERYFGKNESEVFATLNKLKFKVYR